MTIKKDKWLVHGIMYCQKCDWKEEDYLTALKKARKHVEKTGHKVTGDLGYAVELKRDN